MLNFLTQNFIEKRNVVFKKKQGKSKDLAQNFPKLRQKYYKLTKCKSS